MGNFGGSGWCIKLIAMLTNLEVPLPSIGRQLTGREVQVLMNIRADMEPVLKKLFPRTLDKGESELKTVDRKGKDVENNVCRIIDQEFVSSVKEQAEATNGVARHHAVTRQGNIRQMLAAELYSHYSSWSREELLAFIVCKSYNALLSARYVGLPNENASRIIVPGA